MHAYAWRLGGGRQLVKELCDKLLACVAHPHELDGYLSVRIHCNPSVRLLLRYASLTVQGFRAEDLVASRPQFPCILLTCATQLNAASVSSWSGRADSVKNCASERDPGRRSVYVCAIGRPGVYHPLQNRKLVLMVFSSCHIDGQLLRRLLCMNHLYTTRHARKLQNFSSRDFTSVCLLSACYASPTERTHLFKNSQ